MSVSQTDHSGSNPLRGTMKCSMCSLEISADRLAVLPNTRKCVECAAKEPELEEYKEEPLYKGSFQSFG